MNIRELIEKLKQYNPEFVIAVRNYGDDTMDNYEPETVTVDKFVGENRVVLEI